MRLRVSTLTVLAAVGIAAAAFAPAAAGPPLPGTVDLPCATTTLHQDAAWYRPADTPRGLVWLQHGFARTEGNVAALAETLSAAGYLVFSPSLPFLNLDGCTLQNLGDNTAFLDQVARLFATAADPTGPLATSAARAGVGLPALPRRVVFIGHSAGAEAVEYVAHRLHDSDPAAWANLRGLVLLDPVKSFLGDNTDVALADLAATDLPVLTVSGPPALCNNFGSGTAALRAHLHRRFLGVRLTTGEHTDAEGPSSDPLGELLCGTPEPGNVAALQQLATSWTGDYFEGTTDYPAAAAAAFAAHLAVPLAGA
ncbi:alpha/beta hydrolase [Nocardia violaceofusca]|uniref:alpha/beta hydrolase n=1 Tax=Nocardia violaceofusca TaxID=941182 RepID=UPI0007A4A248|nr:alpha/beta hydrolase [Nocardia violaceofusca]